jgi:hypothetical protein
MTIRTRPATKEYRDNWPFPEPDSEADLVEAANNSVEAADNARLATPKVPQVGARVLVNVRDSCGYVPAEVTRVGKRALTVRLDASRHGSDSRTLFIRSSDWWYDVDRT